MSEFGLFAGDGMLAWLAAGAVLLTAELITGSGWLLWPAGAAAAVAVLSRVMILTVAEQAALFAALTIVATYAGRRLVGRTVHAGHDLNDRGARIVGHIGKAATEFSGGLGRVFVDGKEWAAELEADAPLAVGAAVEVVALEGGARLKVRPA